MISKKKSSIILLVLGGLYFSNITAFTTNRNYVSIAEQQTSLQKSIANGKELYVEFCVQCHLATGKGNGSTVPPLDGSDWLTKKRTESIHAIKYGQMGEILVNSKKYNGAMPPPGLSDEEVADVLNYVQNSWSNKQNKMVTVDEVAKVKK
ncbi:cytochrome c [Flavobacterium sp.]|uniref:c-type cytochrome n=1 Tax=Flavobacterium sp. TaxID=239 RepID=UPI002C7E0668|nr:cytochrome c [Flavobacterium sp.]HSD06534.1 cytochrome c [Flavobacterium sp.]